MAVRVHVSCFLVEGEIKSKSKPETGKWEDRWFTDEKMRLY